MSSYLLHALGTSNKVYGYPNATVHNSSFLTCDTVPLQNAAPAQLTISMEQITADLTEFFNAMGIQPSP